MTEGKLDLFIAQLQDSFLKGDFNVLTQIFQLPVVIYSPVGVSVIRGNAQLYDILKQYREELGSVDVASTTLDVEHRETTLNQRLRATVRITDYSEDGSEIRQSLIRYFLLEHEDSYKIEMLEFIKSSLSVSQVERIVH